MPSINSEANKAVVAYVPAIHAGYLTFFNKYPGTHIFVLGKSFIDAYPRLNRDLRALEPREATLALQSLGFDSEVLEISEVGTIGKYSTLILPDEDVSRDFAENYLKGKKVAMENLFLRWDGIFSNKENEVAPGRVITTDVLHQELMRKALKEGERSADWWRQIGALLIKDGETLVLGHIRYFPSDLALDIFGTPRITVDFGERPDLYISMHAEAEVISRAASLGISLEGAELYSSTFPCINCAFLVARSGIKKIYYAQGYSRIDAEAILKNAGVEVVLVKLE